MRRFLKPMAIGASITSLCLLVLFTAGDKPSLNNASAKAQTKQKTNNKVPLPKPKVAALLQTQKIKTKNKSLELKDHLAPLNDLIITKAEKNSLSSAIKALFKNKQDNANKHAEKLSHPVSKKLVKWYALRSPNLTHSHQELSTFLKENPGWPSRARLFAKVERSYLKGEHETTATINHFTKYPPKTRTGAIAFAEALLDNGQTEKAIKLIQTTYHNPNLSNWLEKRILTKHKTHLTVDDHKIRVDRLLYKGKRSKIANAMRAAKNLSKSEQNAANFRAALIRRRLSGAKKILAKLDKNTKNQAGVYLARVQLARRTKNYKTAAKLLTEAKFKPQEITDKDEWWIERRVNTRAAINKHNYETAYKIASNHENPSVNRYKEAEFLSGWIALQFLKKPEIAEQHFSKFKKAADGPRSKSKSTYWLGRAQKILKKEKEATANFKESAALFNTFYGQLAVYQLKNDNTNTITIPEPPKISAEIAKRFIDRQEIKAIIIAHQTEKNSLARLFFAHLRYHLIEPAELHLLAELAASLGYNQSTVRIGKTAMAQNIPLTNYAYPVRFMPEYKPLRSVPEQAMVYSIARQESEFNHKIKSHAGARGLLQVMPNTLKHIARKYKIKSSTAWLTQKPAFNAKVGSAYIGDRHDEFGGSYIMTFAGFNAGPGRVRQWVKQFGDPRSDHIDPIDWIERIPFTETRNYVQKVMANLQVYRARLSNGKSTIKSHQDLLRGKF